MIFGDIKTILVATGALVIGLLLGNIRGEWVGYDKGYAVCEEANRQATRSANERALAEQERLLGDEQRQLADEKAARAELAKSSDDECRELTPAERAALDRIGQ